MKKQNKISKFLKSAAISTFLFLFFGMILMTPVLLLAQTPSPAPEPGTVGIPCDGVDIPCNFSKLVELGSNIMTFLILLSIPIAAIAFAYAGFLMLTAQGNEGQVGQAKEIFTKVAIGFVFVLAAWLIVNTITGALLDEDYYEKLLVKNQIEVNFNYF